MNQRGYYGVGIERGKTEANYWSLFRTAQVLDAAFLFIIGARFKRGAPDTMKAWRHMPVFSYETVDDFNAHRPFDCKLIGVEMVSRAEPLVSYCHPQRAIYLLGAEDNGLSRRAQEICQDVVVIPGVRSLNVAVAG